MNLIFSQKQKLKKDDFCRTPETWLNFIYLILQDNDVP